MKLLSKLSPLLIVVLLAPLFLGGLVYAQTETTTEETTTPTTAEKTLAERLAEHKAAQKTRLTTAQQARLRLRCKAAQISIKQFSGRVTSLENNRKNAHKKIINSLNEVVTKVGDKADTTELQAAIVTLKTMTDKVDSDLADYKQAVSDLGEMDCEADPTAFQATLNDLREQRAALAKASSEIRVYLRETVKPLLQTIKKTVQAKEEDQ